MGEVRAQLNLGNPSKPELKPVTVNALVDTGAFMLCIPENVASQLELPKLEDRIVTIADGSQQKVPFVGPIHIKFDNRQTFVGALVLGNQVLMGVIPMEDMDLVVHPSRQTIVVNPAHPNIAVNPVYAVSTEAMAEANKAFSHYRW